MLRRFRIPLIAAGMLVVAAVLYLGTRMRVPKPQGTFAAGQSAPDFTLNDQDGHPFRLSEQRGTPIVLIFYRGYW